MSVNTHLPGRLRNTPLPFTHSLMPLFEAVVNSIHAIAEANLSTNQGKITIEIIRETQSNLQLDREKTKRGAPPQEPIAGFKITDNGTGFNDKNMMSFETLDSDYKASYGCRGVGRLLWLKAFDSVVVSSVYQEEDQSRKVRNFTFTASKGISNIELDNAPPHLEQKTCIHLSGFKNAYRERSAKTARAIANSLFEHCLWYFVRDGGTPNISILDSGERTDLDQVFDEYMHTSSHKEKIEIKNHEFEITHLKLKSGLTKNPFIAWCAASRVVDQENITGKIAGLHGKIRDPEGDFIYACYVTSRFLDENVRPERIGFDIEESVGSLFSPVLLGFSDIKSAVLASSSSYLSSYLEENTKAGRERVEKFVSSRAPRYRPILKRIEESKLSVDPNISDKELDVLLHRQLSEIESEMLIEGHEVMSLGENEPPKEYQARLSSYLEKADEIKKSDLASYVFHRKVVLDILDKALERDASGKYSKEDLIHQLIAPMRKTSNEETLDKFNLWLIDERLAFHDFLASDKPLSSYSITSSTETKEPDICVFNVYDEPMLVSDSVRMPLAALTIVEIKRPMRNDAAQGEEKDPIEQALKYLQKIRDGKVKTTTGRPIPNAEHTPGFCYVICDLTSTIELRCRFFNLTRAADGLSYFGYNQNFNAYIEVISFDGMANSARERNKAFFDKLGLPTN